MAFFSYSELVRVMVCLHRLTTLDSNTAWYTPAVRRSLDLIPALDRLVATFEQLRAAEAAAPWSPGDKEDEAFGWAIKVFQSMRVTWKDEVAALDGPSDDDNGLLGGDQGGLLSVPAYGYSYDYGDAWLTDMFNMRSI